MWTWTLPTVDEAPAGGGPLLRRYKLARGISVLEGPPGEYREVRFPTQDEINAAVTFYQGGHEYVVDDETKAALIAAGISTEDDFTEVPE